jgi:predicted O-linked N-acetylglucosamine transferase (SPINDLY family)
VNPVLATRSEFGLRPEITVFWCGQSLYKYLPQFDYIFPQIARAIGDCQFVFIEFQKGSYITDLFQNRLEAAFARFGLAARDHCVFLPRLDLPRFLAVIGQCNILLDSIGWSGCNSTLESLATNIPIVTTEGTFMRGRHTSAILRMMEITETIARNVDEYIDISIRLAQNTDWRNKLGTLISVRKHRLYRDPACIFALEDFLERAARSR